MNVCQVHQSELRRAGQPSERWCVAGITTNSPNQTSQPQNSDKSYRANNTDALWEWNQLPWKSRKLYHRETRQRDLTPKDGNWFLAINHNKFTGISLKWQWTGACYPITAINKFTTAIHSIIVLYLQIFSCKKSYPLQNLSVGFILKIFLIFLYSHKICSYKIKRVHRI